MKRAGFFLVLCAMLILPLTACGAKPTDGDTAVTDGVVSRTRTIMNEGKQMLLDAKYYAAPNGRVRGMSKDDLMNEMRSATDKAARGIRQAGDSMDNALSDMTRS